MRWRPTREPMESTIASSPAKLLTIPFIVQRHSLLGCLLWLPATRVSAQPLMASPPRLQTWLFVSFQAKRREKKRVSSVQESKKTAKVALRDAACDSGWLRSTSLTAPFLLFSTFHLSLLAAFALRAAAFFPLALRGTFFSNHSLDRESHAWIRWHNTHSRFSFLFSRGKNVQCSHIQCRSSMSL